MLYRDYFAQCPRCHVALGNFKFITGHMVWRCNDCTGIWMSPDVFHALTRILIPNSAAPSLRKRTDAEAALACPECERIMDKVWAGGGGYILPGVPRAGTGHAVDRCEVHGTWFDRNELQAVLTSLEKIANKPE